MNGLSGSSHLSSSADGDGKATVTRRWFSRIEASLTEESKTTGLSQWVLKALCRLRHSVALTYLSDFDVGAAEEPLVFFPKAGFPYMALNTTTLEMPWLRGPIRVDPSM